MTYAGKYRKMKKHMIVVRSGVGDDGGTGDDGEIRRWWWWVSSVMVEGGCARKRYNDSGGRWVSSMVVEGGRARGRAATLVVVEPGRDDSNCSCFCLIRGLQE
ncbi:hypothetical protein LXL04_035424 [Taraxacum kok-saghyz]